jgi:hypothetical protein
MTLEPGFWSRPTKLKDITIGEVSVVDKGANPGAVITLVKQGDGDALTNIVKLAHDIASGKCGNHATAAQWREAINKAAAREYPERPAHAAFLKFVVEHDDGRAMFHAYKSAQGDVDGKPAPVIKADSAYAQLRKIADEMCRADTSLTRHTAIAKIAADPKHRELWERAKREQAFA